MKEESDKACNFQETPVTNASDLRPLHVRVAKIIPNKWFTLKSRIKYRWMKANSNDCNGINGNGKNGDAIISELDQDVKPLNLQVGDMVEVRSLREITSTLDEKGKFKGLYFMPEMEEFCGKQFKIFKIAEKIKLETNGELRKLRSPSYFLEGVHCSGIFQGGCDRACFHYWREEWLIKVSE